MKDKYHIKNPHKIRDLLLMINILFLDLPQIWTKLLVNDELLELFWTEFLSFRAHLKKTDPETFDSTSLDERMVLWSEKLREMVEE